MRALWFLFICFSAPSFAATPEEVREAVRAQAASRHPDPPKDFWERLGPEALPVLKQMFSEPLSTVERTWVIEGLAHFSDPSVGALLESEIKGSDNSVLKRKMLASMIQSQGDAAYEFVEPFLKDSDPHIRAAVAQGMKRHMKVPRSVERLKRFQSEESQAWVKAEALKTLDFSPKNLPGGRRLVSVNEAAGEIPLALLPEKEWAGDWKGVYIHPDRTGPARAILTRQGDKGWSVQLKLPKRQALELKAGDLEVTHHASKRLHWIEVKNRKEDSVFIGNRKPKQ